MRRRLLALVLAAPVLLVAAPASAGSCISDPWACLGGSPPIWDRCGLPGSGC